MDGMKRKAKDQWIKTNYTGVRYRKHPTRKKGIRFDQYFSIRYQLDGKRIEEGLGWASEGWTEQKAALELAQLKKNAKQGEGPTRLKEKREIQQEEKEAKIKEKEIKEKEAITFNTFFNEHYIPIAEVDKNKHTVVREKSLVAKWISPEIGNLPFNDISPIHLERIKKKMIDSKKQSPRSIQYMLAVVRQVFNHAKRAGYFEGESPTARVRRPTFDNKRLRFLSHDEADKLLTALQGKSQAVYEQAVMSLHCGLRFGEIASLVWGNVDLERGTMAIVDPKNKRTRIAYMTEQVREILKSKKPGKPNDLIFVDRWHKEKINRVSRTFMNVVNDLEFNKDIKDPRQRVVFHTLRHTYASWLVESGTDLYTVKELLGHSTITMTERYAHVGANTMQDAVKRLQEKL